MIRERQDDEDGDGQLEPPDSEDEESEAEQRLERGLRRVGGDGPQGDCRGAGRESGQAELGQDVAAGSEERSCRAGLYLCVRGHDLVAPPGDVGSDALRPR